MRQIELEMVTAPNREPYLEFLLMADESEEMVRSYIQDGEMFSIRFAGKPAGAVLFTFHGHRVIELKNIAIAQGLRGQGIGKMVLKEAFETFRGRGYEKMIVGTANSSIANLAFYQRAGFRMEGIKKDFFANYPAPIYENGIRALDMVMFEKNLKE